MKHVQQILAAYSDCNEFKAGERNLSYFCSVPLTGAELQTLMPECIKEGYNAFDSVNSVVEVIRFFGDTAQFYVAREGSVCIYIKPTEGNIWLNGRVEAINCDEFSFDGNKGMFRVWWD